MDLHTPVDPNSDMTPIRAASRRRLDVIRHSAAHVMADAVQRLFPGTQVTIGPAIESGFYYDFDRPDGPFTDADLAAIEAEMKKIIKDFQQQWRVAWFLFAVGAALVTVWVVRVVPAATRATPHDREINGDPGLRWWPTGAATLVGASFVLGLASVAFWTFGQELVADSTDSSWLPPLVWTVTGAAGIAGAFAGPVLSRLGIPNAWTVLMVLLALGSAGLAVGAGVPAVALLAGSVFGASYIALTGVLLVWATRVFGRRPSAGVGLSFFTIAAGQAVGAPLLGYGSTLTSLSTVFLVSALLAAAGALFRATPSANTAGSR